MWTFLAGWRVVVKRAAADRLVLGAVGITVALATTLLAIGPIYSEAVALSALQRTLQQTPADEANLEIGVLVKPESVSDAGELATPEIDRTFSSVDHEIYESLISESFSLPQQADDGAVDIAFFQYMEGIEDHASLADGVWPQRVDGGQQVAVSDRLAAELDLSVGDQIPMSSRLRPAEQRRPVIVGIYEATGVGDPFWFDDPVGLQGVTRSVSFDTFGPFIVDRETLLSDIAVVNTRLRWRVFVDSETITVDDLPILIGSLRSLEGRLNAVTGETLGSGGGEYQGFGVESRLRPILLEAERSLTVTRSGVLMLSIQLSILAGVALMFIAGLLVETRRTETDLLRSRGATSRQVLGMALMEGGLLTVPVALLAPWLAVLALSLLNHVGPLTAIGLDLDPKPVGAAYILSFVAALGCVTVLALPAYRSARSFSDSYVSRGRQQSRSELQRRGFDLALVALAALGFWQLSIHRETITAGVRGRFGVDPLLIGAPAIGLAAGAILALRALPALAGMADKLTASARSTVPALSAWQIARRPRRYARSALLLIMAVSIGFFAASFTSTWTRSQKDQAAFEVGADLRVTPNRRIGQSITDLHLGDALMGVESIRSTMPVLRMSGGGGGSDSIRRFVVLDASLAGDVALVRDDLGPDFSAAMDLLAAGRPTLPSVPLPGTPIRVAATIGVELEPLPEDLEVPEGASICFCPSVRLILQDADGLLHRVDLGTLGTEADLGMQTLQAHLVLAGVDGQELAPRYPISLIDVEVRSPTPQDIGREATVTFGGVFVSAEATGDNWTLTTERLDRQSWAVQATPVADAFQQPSILPGAEVDDGLEVRITTGRISGQFPLPAFFSIRPAGEVDPRPLPIVTTRRFVGEAGSMVGDAVRLSSLPLTRDAAQIVATIEDFPTVDPGGGEAILIDLPTFQMVNHGPGRDIAVIDEYWLSTEGAPTNAAAVALTESPIEAVEVIDGAEVADLKRTDPIALGTIGSLALGFVAAAVFAVVGFAVSAAISARERVAEFALLRALGLSNGQLGSWLALEQTALVVLSLGIGTSIGLLLSWVVLPLVMVTQAGAAPVPATVLVFPWTTVLLIDLAVVLSLVAIVAVLMVLLRRLGVSSLLRVGIE